MNETRGTPVKKAVEPSPEASHSPWAGVLISFRWPLVLVALALVALVFYLATLRRVDDAGSALGDLASGAADRVEAIAESFLTGNITETFVSSLPKVDSAGSGNLELATIEVTETFRRTDERWALWDTIPLGTIETEIRTPVTYRYHLRLDDSWRLEVFDHTCIVYAPRIHPTQPPAIHTEGIERRVDEGWLRFDGEEQMAALEKSITPRLRQLAGDPRHIELIREQSRKTVAEFVRNWLLTEDHWREDRFRVIQVIFPDEELEAPEQAGPTVLLDDG